MGTRGLKIIRHKGKYYIYYNHWDSNPGIFGTETISLIPTDAEGYQTWLQLTRTLYDELSHALDDLLTIHPPDLFDSSPTIDPSKERYRHWRGLDDQLLQLPSCIPMDYDEPLPCDYEWIYHIDLDREHFTVNYGAHFKLSNIPRNKVWKRALGCDEFGDCTLDMEKIPEECVVDPRFEGEEVRELGRIFKELHVEPVGNFDSGVNPLAETAHHRVLVMLAFESFSWCHRAMLKRFLLEWSPDSFLFRELAYAILSIAAGDFRFQASMRVKGSVKDGYVVLPREETCVGSPEFLSAFARGFHLPRQIPGSAPMGGVYWFNEVLICLSEDLLTCGNSEDAMAKMVLFARDAGVKEFRGIVMSLEHVMFVKSFRDGGGDTVVRHSDLVSLFWIRNHLATHPRDRPPLDDEHRQQSDDGIVDRRIPLRSVEELYAAFPGFLMLMEFMESSMIMRLPPASEGCFPVEIYHMILNHVDDNQTYVSCAKVSKTFRAYCQSYVRLGRSMTITKLHSSKPIAFTVLDHDTGETMAVETDVPWGFTELYSDWNIIIGPPDRPTLLDQVVLNFKTILLPPTIDPRWNRCSHMFVSTKEDAQALRLPRYAPFIFHSRVWTGWLTQLLSPPSHRYLMAEEAPYPVSTAPDLRELSFVYGTYHFRMFLHPVIPDESVPDTKTWEMAIWRVKRKLEMHTYRDGHVLVTFGAIILMFWWTVRPGFQAREYDSLTGGTLSSVLPAMDMREQKHRELVEGWIRDIWKDNWDRGQDCNPPLMVERIAREREERETEERKEGEATWGLAGRDDGVKAGDTAPIGDCSDSGGDGAVPLWLRFRYLSSRYNPSA